MELQVPLRISALCVSKAGNKQIEKVIEHEINSSNSLVATKRVVPRSLCNVNSGTTPSTSVLIKSLSELVGQEEERTLCPVRALKFYLERVKDSRKGVENLFCSVRKPSSAMSKNAISFFIRKLIN